MRVRVILTGTDPRDARGGIGFAMAGYRRALERAGLLEAVIPSYRAGVPGGRIWWPLRALPRLWRAARRVRRAGDLPVVYGHGGKGLGVVRQAALLLILRLAGARTVLHVHTYSVDRYVGTRGGRLFLRLVCAPVDVVCVLTEWWRKRASTAGIRAPLVVIPNPLPPAFEEAARREVASTASDRGPGGSAGPRARQASELNVLTMSRLVEGKGVEAAIRAVALLPAEFRLVVAGDGPARGRYEDLVRKLNLADRVRFPGWVTGAEKTDLLESSDIFCLPTTRDSFGMGLVEAMACGLPVIAVRWGPIPEVVPDEEAGILVEAPEGKTVAGAMRRLADPELRRRLGEGGRQWVLDRLSADRVGVRLREVLERELLPRGETASS